VSQPPRAGPLADKDGVPAAGAVAGPAEDIARASDAVFEALVQRSPIRATYFGVAGHDDRWDDLSPEGWAAWSRALAAIERPAVPAGRSDSAIAAGVLEDFCWLEEQALAHHDHSVDLNPLACPVQLVVMALDAMDKGSAAGRANAIKRLRTLDACLDGYRRDLEAGLDRGQHLAARQVRAVAGQCRRLAGADGHIAEVAEQVGDAAAGQAARAAFAALATALDERILPRAAEADAVGPDRYGRAARHFLGAEVPLAETYAWGWAQVHALRAELAEVAEAIAPGLGPDAVLEQLRSSEHYAAPTHEAFLEAMRERQARALEIVSPQIDIPPALRVLDVRRAPTTGTLGAYYRAPTDDFARPGAVRYALPEQDGPVPLFDQVSTAYHEGIPGHHLQIALQVANAGRRTRLHRLAYGYSGFAEGWALYSERLMDELGAYESPVYRFGMLTNQLARACRVVVDIGLHNGDALGLQVPALADVPGLESGGAWTYEGAVSLMYRYGGLSEAHARSDVLRYLGWPGQAICYSLGLRRMMDLRERWMAIEGRSLRGFHDAVLDIGNVRFDALPTLLGL
jgi:uncharacterized protein (DUF885 family)